MGFWDVMNTQYFCMFAKYPSRVSFFLYVMTKSSWNTKMSISKFIISVKKFVTAMTMRKSVNLAHVGSPLRSSSNSHNILLCPFSSHFLAPPHWAPQGCFSFLQSSGPPDWRVDLRGNWTEEIRGWGSWWC